MTEHSIKPPHRLIGYSLHDDPILLAVTGCINDGFISLVMISLEWLECEFLDVREVLVAN